MEGEVWWTETDILISTGCEPDWFCPRLLYRLLTFSGKGRKIILFAIYILFAIFVSRNIIFPEKFNKKEQLQPSQSHRLSSIVVNVINNYLYG